MALDNDKLNAFMGSFVQDLGAVMHAATIVVGDQLGLYKAAGRRAAGRRDAGRKTEHRRALRARMAVSAGRQRLCRVRPRDAALQPERRTGLRARRRKAARPSSPAHSRSPWRSSRPYPKMIEALQNRQGLGLARTRRGAIPRHRALLPARLCGQPGEQLDSGARRCREPS